MSPTRVRGVMRRSPMFKAGDTFDKYRIVRQLGAGGMALVYQSENGLGLPVVLKVLNPKMKGDASIMERFRREGRIQFTLRHAHIVRVTDIVEDHGVPALVMDYLSGDDLEAVLKRGETFEIDEVADISIKVLDALAKAHEHGYIHRDLKPSNIFLERTDGGREPRVMDFGIAKVKEAAALTQAREFFGTPAYASPEQVESTRDVDHRSDIYSFGVLMWRLLSTEEPYAGLTDPIQVLISVVREPLPALGPRVPAWISEIIGIATQKNPDDRFTSAAEFRDTLIAASMQHLDRTVGGIAGISNTQSQPRVRAPHTSNHGAAVSTDPQPTAAGAAATETGQRPQLTLNIGAEDNVWDAPPGATPSDTGAISTKRNEAVEKPATSRNIAAERSAPQSVRTGTVTAAIPQQSPTHQRRPNYAWLVIPAAILVGVVSLGLIWTFVFKSTSIPADMVRIEPGSFVMGSLPDEPHRRSDEGPVEVTITRPFAISRTEVTLAEFQEFMPGGSHVFTACGPRCPVVNVSWAEAAEYANLRSESEGLRPCYTITGTTSSRRVGWPEGLQCEGYRLPTEAEWEYAARAGSAEPVFSGAVTVTGRGETDPALGSVAVYRPNSNASYDGAIDCNTWSPHHRRCGPQPVGELQNNTWGLFDTLGNVAEWVWDAYAPYPVRPVTDPTGPPEGNTRIVRGCSWMDNVDTCRVASRVSVPPVGRIHIGFRLARTLRR